jgi:hypothetical protein
MGPGRPACRCSPVELPELKRSFPLLALVAVAACDGPGDAPEAVFCVVPTVMPQLVSGGTGTPSALVEVDLGEVLTGPDPVMLTSVHLRRPSGGAPLRFVEAAQLSVPGGMGPAGSLLAAGGIADDDERVVLFPVLDTEVDVRALASGGRLPLQLEVVGTSPPVGASLLVQVCVKKITPRGRL